MTQRSVQDSKRATVIRTRIYFMKGLTGATEGQLIDIVGSMIIGRAADCDLVIDDDGISRHHARIEMRPQGCTVVDLDSANGTLVNGRRIEKTLLEDGDEIAFDTVRFKFRVLRPDDTRPRGNTPPLNEASVPTENDRLPMAVAILLGVLLLLATAGLCYLACF